ncbi:sorbosone dehydrogenase family protein [Terricaulis sp.]|uniref:PQQ-dependent sugar dehydrogenase n=1 Tax=Terricaulis sp. TaxID=2768686 RepID=UPI002AC47CEF|nr:sorbosone dehydrogenase family protein [Terricaulis sp.]MDZ4692024.1 sorbosone dehydrogenase family protein [Terricaulis sp.]
MKKLILAAALALAACGGPPPPIDQGYGANPQLPPPKEDGAIPTLRTADAVGWPAGAAPVAPEGFNVTRFAEGLQHPRWIYVLPNGDVLVAESSTTPSTGGGLMGWARNLVQRRAGAISENANRVSLLRDSDGNGQISADERHVFAQNLNQPFGMALVGDHIYIANTDAVLRFPYTQGATSVSGGETILELPYNEGDNGHWTRSLVANADGTKLYVAVGSASNIADNGMEIEEGRAAVWEFNPDGSEARVFASGLRNPVGMAWAPGTTTLWVAVNERDMLGDNLVPDYMTSVREDAFYGWPYYYYGNNRDERVEIPANVRLREPTAPDYALGAHTASLGLFFYEYDGFPERYWNGAFIGQHGSWNRRALAGYKVVFVPFTEGAPSGPPQDFLTGFLNERGQAQGRPVGIAMDQTGALLVADDAGDIIWRVAHPDAPAPE